MVLSCFWIRDFAFHIGSGEDCSVAKHSDGVFFVEVSIDAFAVFVAGLLRDVLCT